MLITLINGGYDVWLYCRLITAEIPDIAIDWIIPLALEKPAKCRTK